MTSYQKLPPEEPRRSGNSSGLKVNLPVGDVDAPEEVEDVHTHLDTKDLDTKEKVLAFFNKLKCNCEQ